MTDFIKTVKPLVLASGSAIRKTLLENAGLDFQTIPADVDEEKIRDELEAQNGAGPLNVADHLAKEKALFVSRSRPEDYIIGSDQVLALDEEIFGKPDDLEQAYDRIKTLSGKTHLLHTATSVAHGGNIIASHTDTAYMTMRELSSETIKEYLDAVGEGVCRSVGAYQFESLGIQLFSDIQGDYFTILGMNLLPLLQTLREEGIVGS